MADEDALLADLAEFWPLARGWCRMCDGNDDARQRVDGRSSHAPHSAVAYLFEKINIPAVPVVLAFIMGPIIESNLNRALTITGGDMMVILSRPITASILVLAFAAAVYSFVSNIRLARREAAMRDRPDE